MVGDLHQPLHACARCSAGRPDGDDGGNAFRLAAGSSAGAAGTPSPFLCTTSIKVEGVQQIGWLVAICQHDGPLQLLQHRKQRHQSLAEWQRKHKERQRCCSCCRATSLCSCCKRVGTSPVDARRSWKGRSIFSRATENRPAFCAIFCVYKQAHSRMPALCC